MLARCSLFMCFRVIIMNANTTLVEGAKRTRYAEESMGNAWIMRGRRRGDEVEMQKLCAWSVRV